MEFLDKLLGIGKEFTTVDTNVDVTTETRDFLVKFAVLVFLLFLAYRQITK